MARKPAAPPAPFDITLDPDRLARVRASLEKLASQHETSARRHLKTGRNALILGLIFAVFLPAFFTLIDVAVERLRSAIAPGISLEEEAQRIAELTNELEAHHASRKALIDEANAQAFGKVLLRTESGLGDRFPDTDNRFELGCTLPDIGSSRTYHDGRSTIAIGGSIMNEVQGGDFRLYTVPAAGPGQECAFRDFVLPNPPTQFSTVHAELRGSVLLVFLQPYDDAGLLKPVRVFACAAEGDAGGATARGACTALDLPAFLRDRIVWNVAAAAHLGLGYWMRGQSGDLVVDIEVEQDQTRPLAERVTFRRQDIDLGTVGNTSVHLQDRHMFILGEPEGGGSDFVIAAVPQGTVAGLNGGRYTVDWQRIRSSRDIDDISQIVHAVAADGTIVVLTWPDDRRTRLNLTLAGAGRPFVFDVASIIQRDYVTPLAITVIEQEGRELVLIGISEDGSTTALRVFTVPLSDLKAALQADQPASGASPASGSSPLVWNAQPDLAQHALFLQDATWPGEGRLAPVAHVEMLGRARVLAPQIAEAEADLTLMQAFHKKLGEAIVAKQQAEEASREQQIETNRWITIAARLVVILLVLYFVRLEVSLYNQDSRLAGHYRSRLLAIDYLISTGAPLKEKGLESLFAAIVAVDSRDISSKEPPAPATDKLMDLLKTFLERGRPL